MASISDSPQNIVFPDYTNCIVNLSSTVLATFGVDPDHPPLGHLDIGELAKRRNIVLMVFDGLGHETIRAMAESEASYLAARQVATLTSVYPSTTTAAIPAIMGARTPAEHGCLGWNLYFKEYGAYVDYLPFKDHITSARYSRSGFGVRELMSPRNIFTQIAATGADTRYLVPRSLHRGEYAVESSSPAHLHSYGSTASLFRKLRRILRRPPTNGARRFVYSYHNEPDHTIHQQGTTGDGVADVVSEINEQLRQAERDRAGTDTVLLVTADHGLVDTDRTITVNDDPELYESLIMATFPEKRFLSFFVKSHRREQFEGAMAKYREDFLLMSREEFLERGLLGPGTLHPKIDDFVGDYVALAVGSAQMTTAFGRPEFEPHTLVGHHAGLRREEMLVPLIRIDG